jgi:hypothetical protein
MEHRTADDRAVRLKVRAAEERRPMCETLRAAVEAYLDTPVPGERPRTRVGEMR